MKTGHEEIITALGGHALFTTHSPVRAPGVVHGHDV